MFSVYTTADVISRLVESYGEYDCLWQEILSRQMTIYYSGRDDDWSSDPEDLWFIYTSKGTLLEDRSGYIDSLREHPERVLEHPDSAFLLDVDEKTADRIEEEYGVICQSVSTMKKKCKLADRLSMWKLHKKNPNEKDGQDDGVIRTRWKDLLEEGGVRCPSNAMIVIDRNMFREKNFDTDTLFAVEGIPDLLDSLLPSRLKCEYHVLVVYEKGQYFNSAGYASEEDFIEEMGNELERACDGLRDYPIVIELLSVARKDTFNNKTFYDFLDTHSRRADTNYFVLGAEFSLAPFKDDGPRASQNVWLEYLYSDMENRLSCDLAVSEANHVIKVVRRIVYGDKRNHLPLKPVRNRLINNPRELEEMSL